ncbi:hypothetical protein COV58_04455 [Candidatus Roizmanbacteria bacterium CG11_big_fil_rev_8_21_14_0_20_36_8]|uniref:ADP-dependent (S)-NAD(P)H-hydrate dehydratase n=1 Tax=Candidatus Roizmanbacteria bacterium CG11_big_fil_rev_8_21_14_0_20_36_8 TaxID=1974856 RepID=A0A2M6ITH2_9BACT|nr:MAG: hypothetical protein COV58_04455 [Candidatus Roizmanbacteria bacterium CG11_big_fil_rev_8_21_14_0_20_36_8]
MNESDINTKDLNSIKPFSSKFELSSEMSHKGQNGKVLIIGGSELFHSSAIWSAEIASHLVDMVHFSSTKDNNEIFKSLKIKFRSGIIVPKPEIPNYVKEDDSVLLGPGMVRKTIGNHKLPITNFKSIIKIKDEANYSRELSRYLIDKFPNKRFVIDAGALQMIDKEWLNELSMPAIITPHQLEFERLFGVSVANLPIDMQQQIVKQTAHDYNCVILLKVVNDIISDGRVTYTIMGGNQGLTKGGTGDILSGLVVSLYAKHDPVVSAVLSSFILKRAADKLEILSGHWYNVADLINIIPNVLKEIVYN